MKKRKIKKIRLTDTGKGIIVGLMLLVFGIIAIETYNARITAIESNPDGYTESGHAHSVNVQIIR